MPASATREMKATDLTPTRRWIIIILVSMGSSTIYGPAYLRYTFPNPQASALDMTLTQTGQLVSAYAWTAVACYLFSGLIADRVRMRTLMSVGFISTAALTFWYAMVPSFTILIFIFIGMGFTTILIWWGCRYKLVRLVSEESEYPRNIGISYGFYGAAGLIVGLVGAWLLGAMASEATGFKTLLVVEGCLILLLGVLSLIFIPRFEGEIAKGDSAGQVVAIALKSLVNPVVLLTALMTFFVYLFYTSTSYTATYMTALGADSNLTNIVSVVRQFGVTLLAGPVFGALAHKAKRPSLVIWIGSFLAAAGFAVAALLPGEEGSVIGILILAIALGFISNGVFGIVSGGLTEGKVPLAVFGGATGMVSVVGFMPDTFSGIWFGSMIDSAKEAGHEATAYPPLFWILAGSAVCAALCAIALATYIKKNKVRLDAAYEAAEAEAQEQAAEAESEAGDAPAAGGAPKTGA